MKNTHRHKLTIALGVPLLLLFIIAVGILLNGHYFPAAGDLPELPRNDWMGHIRDDALLVDVVLPGSHDAGTCSINYLARTQGYSVETQLIMGARYLDLRVNKTDDGYYLYHAMFNGERLDTVLEAITTFLRAHPTETLVLDFQHFTGGAEAYVPDLLQEVLADQELAVRKDPALSALAFVSALRLSEVRGRCVILFGGSKEVAAQYDFLFPRNNDDCSQTGQALNSCYISEYNQLPSRAFLETALPYYYQNIEAKIETEGYKGLFVLQGQLTDGYLIFGPYAKEKTHHKNMTAYIADLRTDAARLSLTNIIMRDFLTADKCADIIALNYHKGLVKEESKAAFIGMYP